MIGPKKRQCSRKRERGDLTRRKDQRHCYFEQLRLVEVPDLALALHVNVVQVLQSKSFTTSPAE